MTRIGSAFALTFLLVWGAAHAESIPLIRERGTFVVPVAINNKITLNFTIDSGASDVSIPANVFFMLTRAGTISESDFLDTRVYELADGSRQTSRRVRIRSLRVGNTEIRDVVASVSPREGISLLGQSFLSRLKSWSIDNQRQVLLINESITSSSGEAPPLTGNSSQRMDRVQFQINPQFRDAGDFSEGLSAVRDDRTGKWGFVDKLGRMVIAPKFLHSSYFHDGVASVLINQEIRNAIPSIISPDEANDEIMCGLHGKSAFIDRTGRTVITLQKNVYFDCAGNFSDGLAAVRMGDRQTGKWGYVDKSGKMVVTPQFDAASAFNMERAAVRIGDAKTGKWGYIDRSGKIIIDRQFDRADDFSEGLAAIKIGDGNAGKWGYIDKSGKMAVDPQFAYAALFKDSIARVCVGDISTCKWAYINQEGKIVIKPQFDRADDFSDGLAAVSIGHYKSGKWGYIDKSGKMIISPRYREAGGFSGRLAAVFIGEEETGEWGYIDKLGKIVIRPQFGEAHSFSEAMAAVRIGNWKTGKWGYIGK